MAGPFDPYHRWLGIPPKDQPPNHYRLLGLQLFEDDADVIESAADQRMAHLRTFQTGKHSRLSQRLLNEVAAAKLCLLSPQKRAAYDELLRQKLPETAAEVPAPRGAEPVGPELAGLFAQADQGTPAARFRAAARKPSTKLAIVVASAAAAGLLILGLVFWGGPSTAETALLLDWPEDQRKEATLEIDGRSFAVEPSGPLQHRCPPGEHRVVAARPGFEPFAETVTLEKGETKSVRPVWRKVAEKGPTPGPGPTADAGKTPPDGGAAPKGPAKVPSDGTVSIGKPSPPPVEPGDGSAEKQPGETPPKVAAEPGMGEPQPPPVEPQRLAVPSAEAQEVFAAQLEEVYRLSAAKTPEQKLKLAGQLLDLGQKSKDNPTERFVLLRTASELAGDGGDAALMLEAVDAIGADFEVDLLGAKHRLVLKFAEAATDAKRIGSLVENSLPLVDQALEEGRPDMAFELVDAAYRASTRPAGKEHRKQLYERRGEVQKLYEAWKGLQDALAALKTAPDDPQANLIVGQWYCLKQGDWEQGLPYLAKGSDEELKTVAQQELASPPTEADAQVKLADAWWDLAQKANAESKDALLFHAGSWYERAQPSVTASLLKAKIAKRLGDIDDVERPTPEVAIGRPHPEKRPPPSRIVQPFDAATAELLVTLRGHTDSVRSLAFSPRGSVLVSASYDKTVRFWDVAKGQLRGMLPPYKEKELRVAFSPKGSLLAIANGDGTVSLWDPARGRFRGVLAGHTQFVGCVAFSPDGSRLASASDDRRAILWDVASGRPKWVTEGHTHQVRSVAFTPDGSLLATGAGEELVRLWDVATGQFRRTLDVRTQYAVCMAFSPDGSLLACAGNNEIILVNAQTGQRLHTLGGHEPYSESLAFSPDGSTLASASTHGTIRLWDVATAQLRRTLHEHATGVFSLAFSPSGSLLASGNRDGTIRLWGTHPSKKAPEAKPAETTPPDERAETGTTAPGRERTTTAEMEYRSYRWVNGSAGVKMIPGSDGFCFLTALSGRFEGEGEWAKTVIGDQQAWMLLGNSGQTELAAEAVSVSIPAPLKVELKDHSWNRDQPPTKMIHRDEGFCILTGVGGAFRTASHGIDIRVAEDGFWYLSASIPVPLLRATSVRFLPPESVHMDLKEYTWVRGAPPVRMIHKKAGFCLFAGFRGAIQGYQQQVGVSLGQDGYWYLGGRSDQALAARAISVRITKRTSGTEPPNTAPPAERGKTGTTAPGSKPPLIPPAARSSRPKTVKRWDPATAELLATLPGEGTNVCDLAFSPDGSILAVGDENTVKLWGADPRKSKTPANAAK